MNLVKWADPTLPGPQMVSETQYGPQTKTLEDKFRFLI